MATKSFKSTNALASKVYNEMTGRFVDTDIDYLDRVLEGVRKQIEGVSIFTEMEQIGITRGTETLEKVIANLPANSMLIYHKYGDALPMYPERTGLLTVIKGLDDSRIQFTYTGHGFWYVGFYDSLRGTSDLWSGWRNMVTMKDGIFNADNVVCRAFGDGGTTLMHNSLDGNGKNLGWSQSRFKQVVAENGYFDRIETTEPIAVSGASLFRTINEPTMGMTYFDSELSKPLWYNGKNWVDSQGEIIK